MLIEDHIFTIKTKDPTNVADIQKGSSCVSISGLNVLKDFIKLGDLVFVVLGGDNPPWQTGLVALAKIVREPYDEGYNAKKKNDFKVDIDIQVLFASISRGDLVTYPGTYDISGIGPITKWEQNQAVRSVTRSKAITLLHAICDLRPGVEGSIKALLGNEFDEVSNDIDRYILAKSSLGKLPVALKTCNLQDEFKAWLTNIYKKKDGSPIEDTSSYVNCLAFLTDSTTYPGVYNTNSTSYWYNMYHFLYGVDGQSVYEFSSEEEVKSRFEGIIAAVTGGAAPKGVDVKNFKIAQTWSNSPAVKKSSWIKCSFVKYFDFLGWRAQQAKANARGPADLLSASLKLFATERTNADWCGDNTDGDATKPRTGYVANKQLRVLSNTPADITKLTADGASNIKAWFKNYWNVADGKSWLEGLSDADLSGFGPYTAHLLQPGSPAVAKPDKFSNVLEAAVKTIIKPEETGLYDERVNETLRFLGLIGFDWNENFDADDLGEAVNAQRIIKRRLKDMGIKRIQESPTADDGNAPDYLTVNEFLWFVKLNLNRIEKEVQEGKMKPATHKDIDSAQKAKKPKCKMNDNDDVLLLRLRAALRTKPFAILAGHSGTGKSRMVRKLAYMTCNDQSLREDGSGAEAKDPGNFCMVQVKPNWHDSGDLLGYYSELGKRYRASDFVKFIVKAYAYPNTPFFVCLDEMNLAPIEQYFAEYLSAIESRKLKDVKVLSGDPLGEVNANTVVSDELIPRSAYIEGEEANRVIHFDWLGCELKESEYWIKNYGLTIPRNLFVVGTVNMDESTNQFSRKVLDRAMTIEMTDADFNSFGSTGIEPSFNDYMGDDAVKDLLSGVIQATSLNDNQKANLNELKDVLSSTSFAVAYRFANEYALYEDALASTIAVTEMEPETGATDTNDAAEAGGTVSDTADETTEAANEGAEGTATTQVADANVGTGAATKTPVKPDAFDDMVLMKVLPRISGEAEDVRRIFFGEGGKMADPKPKSLLKLVRKDNADTASARKIAAIDGRGGSYLSFWP